MLAIFYNKKNLNDTMIIKTSDLTPNKHIFKENHVIFYNNDVLVGINIFNISKFKNIVEGYLFPTKEIIELIQKITLMNLNNYIDSTFIVGQVQRCEKIPNTNLTFCGVDIQTKKINIVCGASNVKEKLKVVVALNNTIMPNGNFIKKAKIYGIESDGMLCSYTELNILSKQKNKGIIELNNKFEIGTIFKKVYSNL